MPKTGQKLERFIEVVKVLRRRCPWDRIQTFESLKPYLVEEVYEAIQAINDKKYKKLAGELGDMLLHIVMLSVFAEEKKLFKAEDVIDLITAKMIRRHPHVFAGKKAKTKEEVWYRWEKIKQAEAKERGEKHKGILETIPYALPALYRADKVQKRAARVGFDWDKVAGAWDKVHEELEEVHELLGTESRKSKAMPAHAYRQAGGRQVESRIKEEIGDLLFAIVNVARKLDIDAEDALQLANTKFIRRFSNIEKRLQKKKLSLAEMDAIWEKVKAAEK